MAKIGFVTEPDFRPEPIALSAYKEHGRYITVQDGREKRRSDSLHSESQTATRGFPRKDHDVFRSRLRNQVAKICFLSWASILCGVVRQKLEFDGLGHAA